MYVKVAKEEIFPQHSFHDKLMWQEVKISSRYSTVSLLPRILLSSSLLIHLIPTQLGRNCYSSF